MISKSVFNSDDFINIGTGVFGEVFEQKSTGLVYKKLKDNEYKNVEIKSRFKREFEIMKELSDDDCISGIIEVYEYEDNGSECYYTMEKADCTLIEYFSENQSDEDKECAIFEILRIISEVHDKNIIHRDLSPTNIFIINDKIKIADFGLGKNLNVEHSHLTQHTSALGSPRYCAPEQLHETKEGDKRSDVYSCGKLINFIMTMNPENNKHFLGVISNKATNMNNIYRHSDASEILKDVEFITNDLLDTEFRIEMDLKLKEGIFDDDVERYIYLLKNDKLLEYIIEHYDCHEVIIDFMNKSEVNSYQMIKVIDELDKKNKVFDKFKDYDKIAEFAIELLRNDDSSYEVKEFCCDVIIWIAYGVNRDPIKGIINNCIDDVESYPLLKNKFENKRSKYL